MSTKINTVGLHINSCQNGHVTVKMATLAGRRIVKTEYWEQSTAIIEVVPMPDSTTLVHCQYTLYGRCTTLVHFQYVDSMLEKLCFHYDKKWSKKL